MDEAGRGIKGYMRRVFDDRARPALARVADSVAARVANRMQMASRAPAGGLRSTYCYLGNDRALTVTARGYKIYLDTTDVGLTPHIAMSGVWEEHIEDLVRRVLRPGDAAIEVGANMGYHTLVMAEAVGPGGRLHAFEVNPRMIRLLRDTMAVNGLEGWVTLHDVAAMDAPGTITFAVHPEHAGSGYVVTGAPSADYTQQREVQTARMDDLLSDLPAVRLIRLDCEGSEPPALRGAEALIRRSPEVVIISEWSSGMMRTHGPVAEHEAWLKGLGFDHCLEITPDGLVPREIGTLSDVTLADFVFSRGPLGV